MRDFLFLSGLLLLFIFLPTQIFGNDELVIVQAVSSSGKTFIVRKGSEQGVLEGQESLFSTRNSSITAVCTESNRFFSLWKMKDKEGSVPFNKGDYLIQTSSLEGVFSEVPRQQFIPSDEIMFKPRREWIVRGNFSYALSESASDTDSDSISVRNGIQIEGLFASRFHRRWEYALGIRLDNEIATLTEGGIQTVISRYLFTGEILYHFGNYLLGASNYYVGTGLAYGISNTDIEGTISTGTSLILPIVKAGYNWRMKKNYAFILEASIESISQRESFLDHQEQVTSIINSKFSIGVRF